MDEMLIDGEPLTDDELAALALAADPDAPLDREAVPLTDFGPSGAPLLPLWYMPPPALGHPLSGWRRATARATVAVVAASFLFFATQGLCNTYGDALFRF